MDAIAWVIHDWIVCHNQALLWYAGQWSRYSYGDAWQTDYVTLPQTHQDEHHMLLMVGATTGWLKTYPVTHGTGQNTVLGIENQILWQHGTPEKNESGSGTHLKNNLTDKWAKECSIRWIYHIPYHAPASGKKINEAKNHSESIEGGNL